MPRPSTPGPVLDQTGASPPYTPNFGLSFTEDAQQSQNLLAIDYLLAQPVAVIEKSANGVGVTAPASISTTAAAQAMYAVSISMETTGLASAGHTVIATISWTSPVIPHTQTETMSLSGGELIVVETFPILCAANTAIAVAFTYGGGATNDPYTYAVSIVQMPGVL